MNYYETLGVPPDATPDDIKRAYRKMAAKHHPDRGGSTAQFQEIQRAYDTLSDPQKRAQHDNPQQPFGGGFQGGFPGGFHFDGGPNLHDIFDRMFRQQHSQVFRTVLWVTLEQVLNGSEENLRVQTPSGSQFIKVQIPRGVLDGAQVRLDHVIPNGSLLVEFKTQQHPRFQRRGRDLYCEHRLSVLQLIAGTKFVVQTLAGATLEVKLPPLTQPNKTLKVSGAGLPQMNSHEIGDLYINFDLYVPDNIPQHVIDAISTVA